MNDLHFSTSENHFGAHRKTLKNIILPPLPLRLDEILTCIRTDHGAQNFSGILNLQSRTFSSDENNVTQISCDGTSIFHPDEQLSL